MGVLSWVSQPGGADSAALGGRERVLTSVAGRTIGAHAAVCEHPFQIQTPLQLLFRRYPHLGPLPIALRSRVEKHSEKANSRQPH